MQSVFGPEFQRLLQEEPERPVMRLGAVALSYGQLDALARELAPRLCAAQPEGRDGVAVLSPCPMVNLIAFLAAQYAGLVHVPLNPRLSSEELAQVLPRAGCGLILTDTALPERRLPEGLRAIAVDAAGAALPVFHLGPQSAPVRQVAGEDIALIISSSGSSGQPKCVRLSRDRYGRQIARQAATCEVGADRFQLVLPLFHAGGLIGVLGAAMNAGATLCAMQPGPFRAGRVLRHLAEERITLTHWIPTMLYRVAEEMPQGSYDFSSLRGIYFGSMPIDGELLARCSALFPGRLWQTYGSTECGLISSLKPEQIDQGRRVSGRFIDGLGARILTEAGRDAAPGETGEIVVPRSHASIVDYAGLPELTARVVRGDWVHTGDLARNEGEGYFSLAGRKDALIITGGLKVTPTEVEHCLAQHPDIADVAVVGWPDAEFGQAVCAVVQPHGDSDLPLEALRGWAADYLAPYKLPRRLVRIETLPRTDTGKIAYGQVMEAVKAAAERETESSAA